MTKSWPACSWTSGVTPEEEDDGACSVGGLHASGEGLPQVFRCAGSHNSVAVNPSKAYRYLVQLSMKMVLKVLVLQITNVTCQSCCIRSASFTLVFGLFR